MKTKIEELSFRFTGIEFGMIDFEISVGNQKFVDRFSEVWDPLPNFKHWMEAIAIGVQQTSFTYDNEGTDYTFDFERVCYDTEVFTIRDYYNTNKPQLLKANIDRKQLIAAFYNGFFEFTNSERFRLEEWEQVSISDDLCMELKIDEATLIDKLQPLKRVDLNKLVALSYFNQDAINWNAKTFSGGIKLFFDELAKNGNVDKYELKSGKEMWSIAKKYDTLTRGDKNKYLLDYIQNATSWSYDGSKISDFRSGIIENFIA